MIKHQTWKKDAFCHPDKRYCSQYTCAWGHDQMTTTVSQQQEFFCLKRCEKAMRVTLPLITHHITESP